MPRTKVAVEAENLDLDEENTALKAVPMAEEQPLAVKQMVRWLSKLPVNPAHRDPNISTAQEVDAELSEWYYKGYKHIATHYIGENEQAFGLVYVLTLVEP